MLDRFLLFLSTDRIELDGSTTGKVRLSSFPTGIGERRRKELTKGGRNRALLTISEGRRDRFRLAYGLLMGVLSQELIRSRSHIACLV